MARYSETLIDHFSSPRNFGQLEHPDYVGVAGMIGYGRSVVLYVKLDGERISEVRCRCQGCGPTIASASVLTELMHGRTLAECHDITSDTIIEALDGMPADKRHLVGFVLESLKQIVRESASD